MDTNIINNQIIMPTLCVKGIVILPNMILHFDVARPKSIEAVNAAMERNRTIFLITQRDIDVDNPTKNDLYSVGMVSKIKNLLKNSDGSIRVLVEGVFKAKLIDLYSDTPYFECKISKLEDSTEIMDESKTDALVRALKTTFSKYGTISTRISKEIVATILSESDPKILFDLIVQSVFIGYKDKQKLLEKFNLEDQLEFLIGVISKEIAIIKYEIDIYEQVKERVDKSQKNYFLKEQMKVISNELGEDEGEAGEIEGYISKVEKIKNISKDAREKLLKEINRLKKMPSSSQEANVLRMYIEICLELPWDKKTKVKLDIDKAEEILNDNHYGLKKIKERILEFIAVRKLAPNIKGQIICLVGPPGVGKTSIARSIATAIGRKHVRVSLGGIRDESDIRGHRKTYVGSMPGRLITAIKQAKTKNPVIVLDEIDKMGADFRGDPSSAMLEVLDTEQNFEFRDHYIDMDFDLSEVIFICTANSVEKIPTPLMDRMELIHLTSYTRDEKFNIAKKHLIKKQFDQHGITEDMVSIKDEVIYKLIDNYTRESGVRKLERKIASLLRKSAKKIVSGESNKILIDNNSLIEMLGAEKYKVEFFNEESKVGVTNGLAWTSVGGDILQIEVLIVEGKGKLQLTGNLGNVMQESAKTAVSFIRSVADQYSIDPDFYKNKDIHIHVPEGAIPKDGPSAGITMTTAVLSALSGMAVRSDVAMTGEVTLRGRVLGIGGLKEKCMAAHRSGIKTIIIPESNYHDLDEIDEVVRNDIKFVTVKDAKEVLKTALIEK